MYVINGAVDGKDFADNKVIGNEFRYSVTFSDNISYGIYQFSFMSNVYVYFLLKRYASIAIPK